jgi:hypothetical protein
MSADIIQFEKKPHAERPPIKRFVDTRSQLVACARAISMATDLVAQLRVIDQLCFVNDEDEFERPNDIARALEAVVGQLERVDDLLGNMGTQAWIDDAQTKSWYVRDLLLMAAWAFRSAQPPSGGGVTTSPRAATVRVALSLLEKLCREFRSRERMLGTAVRQ